MLDSRRVSGAALLLLPAGLIAYFAFRSGGFFPDAPAYGAIVLAVAVALRLLVAPRPLEGAGWAVALGLIGLGAYTLLSLISEGWSHAPESALQEFDRSLVYLLAVALFGSYARSRLRLGWLVRILAAAIFAICLGALITRLLPHVWPTAPNTANNRLSFPVGYWNVLGLMAAFGILLCVHLASEDREPLAVRVLGAGAVPILASTLYFTFSRGSIGVCAVGVLVYVLLGRPRALLSGALAVLPMTAVALLVAYHAAALATLDPTRPAGVRQGHHVAIVVLVVSLGALAIRALAGLVLDRRLRAFTLSPARRRPVVAGGWGALAVGAVILLVAFSGRIGHLVHGFSQPPTHEGHLDLRARLTDPSNDGRIELWKVAWHQFKAKPLLGHGAGTFRETWARYRPNSAYVLNAHSLYLQTLDELGIVGGVLLFGVVLLMLIRAGIRVRGPDRALYAAIFAVLLAWALEAGIDWDWEMPAVSIVVFVLGGFVLARPPVVAAEGEAPTAPPVGAPAASSRRHGVLGSSIRPVAATLALLLAVAPAYMFISQLRLNDATRAFARHDCASATRDALSVLSTLGIRGQAYEVLAFCDVRQNEPNLAVTAAKKAIALDPRAWNYYYDLAIMQAADGKSPIDATRQALELDPHEPIVKVEWKIFAGDTIQEWQADGTNLADGETNL